MVSLVKTSLGMARFGKTSLKLGERDLQGLLCGTGRRTNIRVSREGP